MVIQQKNSSSLLISLFLLTANLFWTSYLNQSFICFLVFGPWWSLGQKAIHIKPAIYHGEVSFNGPACHKLLKNIYKRGLKGKCGLKHFATSKKLFMLVLELILVRTLLNSLHNYKAVVFCRLFFIMLGSSFRLREGL